MQDLFEKYFEKSRFALAKKRFELASKAIRSALHILPYDHDAILCKVEILRKRELHQEAIACLLDVLEHQPYRPWWVLELADLLINRAHAPVKALYWLTRLLRGGHLSKKEEQRAFHLQVEALIDQDRIYEAWLVLRKALINHPHQTNLLFLHGWVSLQLSRYYASASTFKKILLHDPSHVDAHYYLGVAYEGLGEIESMKQQFATTHRLDLLHPPEQRFSHEEFKTLAREVLSEEIAAGNIPNLILMVENYPNSHVLSDFPHDSRRMGALVPYRLTQSIPRLHPGDVLILYQWNIERYCFTKSEIQDEIRQTLQQEITIQSDMDKALTSSAIA